MRIFAVLAILAFSRLEECHAQLCAVQVGARFHLSWTMRKAATGSLGTLALEVELAHLGLGETHFWGLSAHHVD